MKKAFFDSARPGKEVELKDKTFELPILYHRDDSFLVFYGADPDKVRAVMPSERLHPVLIGRKRAMVVIAAFNYINTSIGPYGEVAIAVPVVHGSKPPPKIIPGILESRFPNFGMVVLHLPVTNTTARDGGRWGWGYPKFVADMRFTVTPEYLECDLSEGDSHILTVRTARRGMLKKDNKSLVTYSVKDGNLVKTVIPVKGTYRFQVMPRKSGIQLGDHPVAQSIKEWGLSKKPVASRYYLERFAILPEGKVVEERVKPLDGHMGEDHDGRHEVEYV